MDAQSQSPPQGRKSLVAKLGGAVAAHAVMSLAIIVVLVVLVIGLVVYYRGILGFGPYAHRGGAGKKKQTFMAETDAGSVDSSPSGDAETERLIDSINRQ
ncbi:MAG: hypothetical protein WC700_04060 [Gemmatimonadaceae bacterium]|jgi:hypothetical protein